MVRLFLLDSVLSFLGGMSFRPHTVDFHRGGGGDLTWRETITLLNFKFPTVPPPKSNNHKESMTTLHQTRLSHRTLARRINLPKPPDHSHPARPPPLGR